MNQNPILVSTGIRFWPLARSKPCLMDTTIPTALFVTADATSASGRVIGWVLNPWGHQ